MYISFQLQCPVIPFRFQLNLNILHIFSSSTQIHFVKILPVGAELFYAHGHTHTQTDRHDEPNSLFAQYSNQ
jgi:hypothetical protein